MTPLSRFVTAGDGLLRQSTAYVTKTHCSARTALQIVMLATNPLDSWRLMFAA
jgi:hypothetical protein